MATKRRRKSGSPDQSSVTSDFLGVSIALGGDVGYAEAQAGDDAGQFERRSYVRTLFAFVEGAAYCGRRLAAYDARLPERARQRAQVAAKDARKQGKKAQEVERTALAVRALFAAMAAAHRVESPLDTTGDDWERFREAIQIRNRITHPRSEAHCEISDADIRLVREAARWYRQMSRALADAVNTSAGEGERGTFATRCLGDPKEET